jgi:outer membrane protein assembly factor BamB
VYVGTAGGSLVAINATNGKKRWSTNVGPNQNQASLSVANHVVFVTNSGFGSSTLIAVNATTGKVIREISFGQGTNVQSSPAVANGRVYVGSDDYGMYSFGIS